jgi:hypothetical protein
MSVDLILVDTSAWIEFWKRPDSPVAEAVEGLLREERVALAGVVVAEVLQGVKRREERDFIQEHFADLAFLEADRQDWTLTGWMLYSLRSKGINLPLTDALLAQLCLRHGVRLLSLDQHFDQIPELRRFRVRE